MGSLVNLLTDTAGSFIVERGFAGGRPIERGLLISMCGRRRCCACWHQRRRDELGDILDRQAVGAEFGKQLLDSRLVAFDIDAGGGWTSFYSFCFKLKFSKKPVEHDLLIINRSSSDLGEKLQSVRLDWRGILQPFVAVAAHGTQIGGNVLSALGLIHDVPNRQTNGAV